MDDDRVQVDLPDHGSMLRSAAREPDQLIDERVDVRGSLSAHADSAEILRWLKGFKRPPKTTFIIHGEPDGAEALRDLIIKDLGWDVVIPAY